MERNQRPAPVPDPVRPVLREQRPVTSGAGHEGIQLVREVCLGEHFLAGAESQLSAVVGASICLTAHDPKLGIGGAVHFLLPGESAAKAWVDIGSPSLREGNLIIEHLFTAIHKAGGHRSRLHLGVFGAARLGPEAEATAAHNHAFLRTFLNLERLATITVALGGHQARQVGFSPRTGEIEVYPLSETAGEAIRRAESVYLSRRPPTTADSIELF
jgi:chemotaxis receptor (MCP) glutamine deamidase CheD